MTGPEIILAPIGAACVTAAIVHGYLGQTKLINPASFESVMAKGFVTMIWQYSTLSWALIGLFIACSPWILTAQQRVWMIPLSCLPILSGVIGNIYVSNGRHFGWKIFAAIIAAASIAAQV